MTEHPTAADYLTAAKVAHHEFPRLNLADLFVAKAEEIETRGPWNTWDEVPDGVPYRAQAAESYVYINREGLRFHEFSGYLSNQGDDYVNSLAPLVHPDYTINVETPERDTAEDYWCAEYDSQGNIRLNCGNGLLVAYEKHTRADVQKWFDRSQPGRYREQYRSALALLNGRRCPTLEKETQS